MALLDDVKIALRVTTNALDSEITLWIGAAKADMERVGVPSDKLQDNISDPYIKSAITLFVKAHFGYDNSEAPRFQESYRQMVKDILNSPSLFSSGDTT